MNKLYAVIFGLLISVQVSAQVSVTGFTLRHCSAERICLEIEGAQAQKSSLGQIWSVNNAQVRIVDLSQQTLVSEWIEKTVIVDEFSRQVMVLDTASEKEWQISLENLKVIPIF